MIKCRSLCVQFISLLVIIRFTNGQQNHNHHQNHNHKVARVPIAVPDSQPASSDSELAETGFAGAVAAGSKYFQYAHVPGKDHYEFGHKRGNDHHFNERHEKSHPHEGKFKTKVRWGDKHGGYGEHYWDYNHAGHDGDGEESQVQEQYVPYEEPAQTNNNPRHARGSNDDVEFINEESRSRILSGSTSKHGGNYRRLPGLERNRRQYPFDD